MIIVQLCQLPYLLASMFKIILLFDNGINMNHCSCHITLGWTNSRGGPGHRNIGEVW